MTTVAHVAGYKLKGILGSAGLTETYRARRLRDGGPRSVALKLLRLDRFPDETRGLARERFLAAAGRAQATPVGGMSPIVEVGEAPVGPFVVSELVTGLDLAHLVQLARKRDPAARGLEPSLAQAICAQVARVLTSAHESSPPLPHLGLGPSRVRITLSAGVVLVDFGLNAALRGLGAPALSAWHFLPPELLAMDASGEFQGSCEAADLYSLGGLLYFLLTGRPPVEGRSLSEMVERAWEPLPEVPGAPDELVDVMRRLTSPEPAKRPRSAREATDLLMPSNASAQERHQRIVVALRKLGIRERAPRAGAAASADEPAASAPPTGRHWAKPEGRWQLALGVAAAVGLLVTCIGYLALHRSPRAPRGDGDEIATTSPTSSAFATIEIPPQVPHDAGGVDTGTPLDREFRVMPKHKLPRVPGHLNLDSTPSDADVWIDGELRGKTPIDLVIGDGGHRVVVLKEGYRMKRDVYDTTRGEWVRVALQPAPSPTGRSFVNVYCRGTGHYPVSVDDEETGRLCPAPMVPVPPGPHKVAIFVPLRRGFVETQVDVPAAGKPVSVTLGN